MAAKFIAEEGLLKGLVLSLDQGNQWVMGRDPDECQLVIEDPSASRRHLICRSMPEGIVIENLSTTNPVSVNEKEISEPQLLKQGDLVKIGSGLFRFYSDISTHIDNIPNQEKQLDASNQVDASNQEKQLNGTPEQPMHEERDTIFEEDQEEKLSSPQIDIDLLDVGPWLLKVVSGPNNGAEFSMDIDTSYVIGTDPATCDIVFNDVSVSRQHARLTLSKDAEMIIEDLKSRNGTAIEGKTIQDKTILLPNTLVSVGTSSFIVYDREGERQTIISPLLPAIVKVLQQDAEKKEAAQRQSQEEEEAAKQAEKIAADASEPVPASASPSRTDKAFMSIGTLIFLGILTGLFVVVGMGTMMLFKSETIETPRIDIDQSLKDVLTPYPNVKYSFNKSIGRLLLVGHVLTAVDRNQLIYSLQMLPFIKDIDNNVIIDEFIWQEINQVLSKTPNWKGVTVYSPEAGRFIITGYLQTRKQAEQLYDYLSQNFSYLDLLERRVVVEEDVATQTSIILQDAGLRDISVKMANGEISLSGNILSGQKKALNESLNKIREISGIRTVKNFVAELPTEESIINITDDNYRVTGFSTQKNGAMTIVIKGKILSRGDLLDGMVVKEIQPSSVILEKDGVKYRIDYNR